jgi:hypothetical protein
LRDIRKPYEQTLTTELSPGEQHLLLVVIGFYKDACASPEEAATLEAVMDKLDLTPRPAGDERSIR